MKDNAVPDSNGVVAAERRDKDEQLSQARIHLVVDLKCDVVLLERRSKRRNELNSSDLKMKKIITC